METSKNKFTNWLRNSITARMLVVGFLLVVLLIPLQFVKELIYERSYRQAEVIREINDKWGNEVTLSGPILKIPYNTYKEDKIYNEKKKKFEIVTETILKYAYVLPETLKINADVQTEPLNRSIYESIVYTSQIGFEGAFIPIDFTEQDIKKDDIVWQKSTLLFQTSNIKGIKSSLDVSFNGTTLEMTPKFDASYLNTIQSKPIKDLASFNASDMSFQFDVKINGSENIRFIPIGKETIVDMNSNWHSPSFDGMYLPANDSKEITPNGFKAHWEVYQLNRQFEQQFFGNFPDLTRFSFGTSLVIPVDQYTKTERTAKYGFMVIGLTLLVFLMIQIGSKLYIHPFQYVMIGLALVMFYTLLISITEHSSFFKGYVIAATAVLALITMYSKLILKGFKFPLLVGTSLASLYGFIYVIIQLENYALLVGSIGLFIILAIIMFASRKIDWGNE